MRLNDLLFWNQALCWQALRRILEKAMAGKADGHLRNRLLASMPASDYSLVESSLQSATYEQGVVLQEAGKTIDKIYFPQDGMISLLVITQQGGGIESATS